MKYEIMMSCGHEDTVELFGKEKERDRKIEYFKIHGLCKECYRKKKEEETQKEGLIFNATVLPYINEKDGSILLSVWFSGDTKPHKDEIKSLKNYSFLYCGYWLLRIFNFIHFLSIFFF
jgi:ribonuclease BN (tRNA processing enzyme)